MKTKTIGVTYERDEDGWWVASVSSVPGCHTQGRSLKQARERIREALGLFVEGVNRVELVDDVRLPAKLDELIREYKRARREAEHWTKRTRFLAWKAVRTAAGQTGLSVRDAGELLELSHQRVQQILTEKEVLSAS